MQVSNFNSVERKNEMDIFNRSRLLKSCMSMLVNRLFVFNNASIAREYCAHLPCSTGEIR